MSRVASQERIAEPSVNILVPPFNEDIVAAARKTGVRSRSNRGAEYLDLCVSESRSRARQSLSSSTKKELVVDMQKTPWNHKQERTVVQSVKISVPPIKEQIGEALQAVPQKRGETEGRSNHDKGVPPIKARMCVRSCLRSA